MAGALQPSGPRYLLAVALAVSGAACLLERLGQEPILIQPAPEAKNKGDVEDVLRSETISDEEHSKASQRAKGA